MKRLFAGIVLVFTAFAGPASAQLRVDITEGFRAPLPIAVPEFFGDTMLVNGLVYPSVHLEQRRYRLRVLNACNSRFCRLRLFYAHGAAFPENTEANTREPGPPFVQIGTEGGFLPEPVLLTKKPIGWFWADEGVVAAASSPIVTSARQVRIDSPP